MLNIQIKIYSVINSVQKYVYVLKCTRCCKLNRLWELPLPHHAALVVSNHGVITARHSLHLSHLKCHIQTIRQGIFS